MRGILAAALTLAALPAFGQYDILIEHGAIYDGSGHAPFTGDVAIKGDRIVYVGPKAKGSAAKTIDATGLAVAPGFTNMLSHVEHSLLVDSRALSDLTQGITLEVLGEGHSMGPESQAMAERDLARQGDLKFPITWKTLGGYLQGVQDKGVAVNVASTVGAAQVRDFVLGEDDVQPDAAQLAEMRKLVKEAMLEGALGVSSALIYAPGTYARTPELAALATEAGQCGGIYISHIRSEGDRLIEAIDELISISKTSGAPAEIFHLKAAGRGNWDKLDTAIAHIEAARKSGPRVTADMYAYTAGATGLDAAMPPWVQAGGLESWIGRLKDPAIRAKVADQMRDPKAGFENLYLHAGAAGTLLLAFKNPDLKPLTGKTLAEVAKERGKSPEDTAIDLVIEDGSRVGVAYFLMSEDNIKKQMRLPWVSFGSDEQAPAPEGVFLKSNPHPRAYGNFAKVLGHYVRDEKVMSLQEAIRRLSALPAANLSLKDRGRLQKGYYADLVLFDAGKIADHATYEKPHQLATGVVDVIVNGSLALENGAPTGKLNGRFVKGRAASQGCKQSAAAWDWSK